MTLKKAQVGNVAKVSTMSVSLFCYIAKLPLVKISQPNRHCKLVLFKLTAWNVSFDRWSDADLRQRCRFLIFQSTFSDLARSMFKLWVAKKCLKQSTRLSDLLFFLFCSTIWVIYRNIYQLQFSAKSWQQCWFTTTRLVKFLCLLIVYENYLYLDLKSVAS